MKISLNRTDAIWGFIGVFLSMGINFLMLPFILNFLDDTSLALYYVFTSLSGIAVMFDFGFSPSIARSMAYAWCGARNLSKQGADIGNHGGPNYELMKALEISCKRIYLVISSMAFFLCCTIGTYYIYYITRNNSSVKYFIAWGLYSLAIFLNLLVGYYSVFLRGVGDIEGINKVTSLSRIVQLVLCVILLYFGLGVVGVAIAYLAYGLLFRIAANWKFNKFKNIGKKLHTIIVLNNNYSTKNILKSIWPNTWRDGIVTVSNYILNQATTIIASLYLSLYETGIYSICGQLMGAVSMIAGTMYTAYQPTLQSAYVNDDLEKQQNCMSAVVLSYIGLFIVGAGVILIIGRPIIAIIRPSCDLSIHLLTVTGIHQFILKYRNCYTSYISATNRLVYTKAFLVSAVLCIGVSILFVDGLKWGVYGLALGQIVSQIVYNAWKWPVLVHRELKYSFFETFSKGSHELMLMVRNKKTVNRY